jgi:hypothetical protein
VERYSLWRLAAEKACEAGDVAAAIGIADKIQSDFEGDTESIKAELLAAGANRVGTSESAHNFIETAMKLAMAAAAREDYDAALRYAKLATGAVRRSKDPQFNRELVAREHEIEKLRSRYAAVEKAMTTLGNDANNPSANLTLGSWYCFVKGDWDKGLPNLAKGSRDDLAALAKRELPKPTGAREQVALADAWWALGDKERESKAIYRARAVYWYERAAPSLTGLEKVRVDKQIESAKQVAMQAPHEANPGPREIGPRGAMQQGNVALLTNGTTVEGATVDPTVMLNDIINPDRATQATPPCEFTVTFAKVYQLRQIRVRVAGDMSASWALFVSRDGRKFDLMEDHRQENLKEWQDYRFSARPVKAVKLAFTRSSGSWVEIAKFEAYCYPLGANGNRQPGARR